MSTQGDFSLTLELERKDLNEQLKVAHMKQIIEDVEINSSQRAMPLYAAFRNAVAQVEKVADTIVKTGYNAKKHVLTFQSPAKWIIVVIGCQEGIGQLNYQLQNQRNNFLNRINIIVVCLFSGNEELSTENAKIVRELVEQTAEGAFLLLRCTAYDTKEKKTRVDDVLVKVINSMQLYRSQNIPVIHEELNF